MLNNTAANITTDRCKHINCGWAEKSAPSVSAVTIGTQQQRDVIMLRNVRYSKYDINLGIEGLRAGAFKVSFYKEAYFIYSWNNIKH